MRINKVFFRVLFLSLVGILLSSFISSAAERYDIIIKGGKIVDGMGRLGVIGDVAIRGDKIVAMGNVVGEAAKVIDATGLIVCPGFIDTHSHADGNILQYPLAENYIMQGVTMVLGGQCGGSAAPRKDLSFGDWMTKVEKTPISVNLAMLVGLTSTIRNLVLGDDDFKRDATKDEVEREKAYMEEAMRAGAFGLSTALTSGPREYTSDEELIETAKVAQKYGGIWSAHTRWQEWDWVKKDRMDMFYGLTFDPPGEVFSGRWHGLLECVDLSRRANNIPQMIAHFNTGYLIPFPHPTYLDEASAMATLDTVINPALAAGQKVYYNIIAPDNSGTGRETQLIEWFFSKRLGIPDWLKNMKPEEFVAGLKTPEFREKIKQVIYSGRFKFKYVSTMQDPYWMDCFRVLTHKNPAYVGRTIGDLARERSPFNLKKAAYDESVNVVFDLIVEDPSTTWADILDRREDTGSHRVFFKHPSGVPCSDTSCSPAVLEPGKPKPGPGAYGFMPHYIDTQVKKYNNLTVEEAVMKATYVPAQMILGLKDRGVLSPDAYADIVVFNLDKIRWSGDFLKPNIPPEGIAYVLVNGKVAYKDKASTGEKSGKLLRHKY